MRFIGNKENIVDKIYNIMSTKQIEGESFFDFFSGTTSVSRFFKKLNYTIYSSDLMYFSFVLQQAYIVNNEEPQFKKLIAEINFKSNSLFSSPLQIVVEYLNSIEPVFGFITNNYSPIGTSELETPRMYFSNENASIIDAIRIQIENWKSSELISSAEYFILLACLIESVPFYANISGVYAAFHKKWDSRALKKLTLRPIEIIVGNNFNQSFNINSTELLNLVQADIFYLDPPYNQRQYAPNYHLLETIALYDNPTIKGVGGLREYQDKKSKFCNSKTAVEEVNYIAKNGKFKTLVMSYNSEGIMPKENILSTLKEFGKVELVEFEYLRYKSNNNGESKIKKFINEQLYILTK